MQVHAHHVACGAAMRRQVGFNLLQFVQFVAGPVVQQCADGVLPAHRRAKKAQPHRFAHQQAEFLCRQAGVGAFFHAKRRQAQRLDRRLDAGHRRAQPIDEVEILLA